VKITKKISVAFWIFYKFLCRTALELVLLSQ